VVNTIVANYCDHEPLYPQAAILEREAGVVWANGSDRSSERCGGICSPHPIGAEVGESL
jgi:hypothetical protein